MLTNANGFVWVLLLTKRSWFCRIFFRLSSLYVNHLLTSSDDIFVCRSFMLNNAHVFNDILLAVKVCLNQCTWFWMVFSGCQVFMSTNTHGFVCHCSVCWAFMLTSAHCFMIFHMFRLSSLYGNQHFWSWLLSFWLSSQSVKPTVEHKLLCKLSFWLSILNVNLRIRFCLLLSSLINQYQISSLYAYNTLG